MSCDTVIYQIRCHCIEQQLLFTLLYGV